MAKDIDTVRRKIVSIEDDAGTIDLYKLILEREGFAVIGTASALEGLELIKRIKPDLVLLDILMPEIDGWHVYQHMKMDEQMSTVPVIVVTAMAQDIDKVVGLNIAKVQDYITKPFSPDELITSIHRVLGVAGSGA